MRACAHEPASCGTWWCVHFHACLELTLDDRQGKEAAQEKRIERKKQKKAPAQPSPSRQPCTCTWPMKSRCRTYCAECDGYLRD